MKTIKFLIAAIAMTSLVSNTAFAQSCVKVKKQGGVYALSAEQGHLSKNAQTQMAKQLKIAGIVTPIASLAFIKVQDYVWSATIENGPLQVLGITVQQAFIGSIIVGGILYYIGHTMDYNRQVTASLIAEAYGWKKTNEVAQMIIDEMSAEGWDVEQQELYRVIRGLNEYGRLCHSVTRHNGGPSGYSSKEMFYFYPYQDIIASMLHYGETKLK